MSSASEAPRLGGKVRALRRREGLSQAQLAARLERKEGLTVPELSVLLAYTKIVLADELLETGLADDPFLRNELFGYFPSAMRQTYRDQMTSHPLRKEIVVTQVVNELVNGAGITFFHRLSEETGASVDELVRANFVARELFGAKALIDEVNAFDNKIPAHVQTHMRLEMRTLVERASRWLINNRRPPLDSEATVDYFGVMIQQVVQALPELLTGREQAAFEKRRNSLVEQGVPEDLAVRVAVLARLAVLRPDVRFVVITLPEQHGGLPEWWLQIAEGLAAEGFGVIVTTSPTTAANLEARVVELGGAIAEVPA